MNKATISWNGQMSFDAIVSKTHKIKMDAAEASGGADSGARPKELLLAGLGGCTGMDVIGILSKMKIVPEKLDIEISAEQTDEHPKVFKNIHVKYIFKGENLSMEKLEKAVNLSKDKYCGVNAMLSKTAEITNEIVIV